MQLGEPYSVNPISRIAPGVCDPAMQANTQTSTETYPNMFVERSFVM